MLGCAIYQDNKTVGFILRGRNPLAYRRVQSIARAIEGLLKPKGRADATAAHAGRLNK
jgi:hypothetical protein